jgi:hypothetical protein
MRDHDIERLADVCAHAHPTGHEPLVAANVHDLAHAFARGDVRAYRNPGASGPLDGPELLSLFWDEADGPLEAQDWSRFRAAFFDVVEKIRERS